MSHDDRLKLETDFSMVQGGPLFQLFLKCVLINSAHGLLLRRILFLMMLTWLPLLVLSMAAGQALGEVRIPLLYDLETHVRFLLSLPMLLLAEWMVHQRLRPMIAQFVTRGIVVPEQRSAFDTCIADALRLRNSVVIELLLIVLVYTVGHSIFFDIYLVKASTWYVSDTIPTKLSAAGYWLGYVSLPIYQFLLLRWLFRILVWTFFLWRVSRLELKLIPTHPDHAAGLGFLAQSVAAFVPLLMSQGALLSGMIAERILFQGAELTAFKPEIVVITLFLLVLVLGPMSVFAPHLARAKRKGLSDYGVLASRYVGEFDRKWLEGHNETHEPLLGSGDIQSLADLNNSVEIISSMRIVPFNRQAVVHAALAALFPLSPLLLTIISLEDLLKRLIGILL